MAMTMSTQTLGEAARQLAAATLLDSIQIGTVGDPVTVKFAVTREFTAVGEPVPGLVQTTTLQNAAESRTVNTYSIKVTQGTELAKGDAVKVISCVLEPSLVDKVLLVDKVSQNGAAMLRKAVASDSDNVNQEGKGDIA
jgi:hypothetical protein